MHTSVGALLADSARRFADKTALVFEERRYSYAEFDRHSSTLAARLEGLGLSRGDRISIYAPNSPEWVIAYYAVMKMGGVANPLNLMLTSQEAAYAMNDCGARAVIGAADKITALEPVLGSTRLEHRIAWGEAIPRGALAFDTLLQGEAPAPGRYPLPGIALDDPCTVGYTSGTTGHPKGALLTHRAIVLNVEMTALMHVRTAADTMVSALPCSHVYGNVAMQSLLAHGGTVVLHRSFDAQRVLESIERHRATMFEGVPTMYLYLLNHPGLGSHDLSSLTRCTVGGQTIERAIAEHPGVAMVAVGPLHDEIKGELAKAYVVAKQGVMLDLTDLERHCRERLAAYKVPRAFQIVADLPKTSTGKVLRRELHTLDSR